MELEAARITIEMELNELRQRIDILEAKGRKIPFLADNSQNSDIIKKINDIIKYLNGVKL